MTELTPERRREKARQRIEAYLRCCETIYINLRTDDLHDLLEALDAAEVRIAELEAEREDNKITSVGGFVKRVKESL
jgi:hypothetical protein